MISKLIKSLSLIPLIPICLYGFEIQDDEYQIKSVILGHLSESSAAHADENDYIYLHPGDDFIRIYLNGIDEGFTVLFDGLRAQIPIKDGYFQIPRFLVTGESISLEYSTNGLQISGTTVFLQPD